MVGFFFSDKTGTFSRRYVAGRSESFTFPISVDKYCFLSSTSNFTQLKKKRNRKPGSSGNPVKMTAWRFPTREPSCWRPHNCRSLSRDSFVTHRSCSRLAQKNVTFIEEHKALGQNSCSRFVFSNHFLFNAEPPAEQVRVAGNYLLGILLSAFGATIFFWQSQQGWCSSEAVRPYFWVVMTTTTMAV